MKLIIVRHGEPDRQNNCLTIRGKRQVKMLAERLRKDCAQAVMISVITCFHSYPKQTTELLLDDAKNYWFCGTPNTHLKACSVPLDTLKTIEKEMLDWEYLTCTAIVLIGHKEDALYLPTMYGLQHSVNLTGSEIGYGEALVIDCETMKSRIITPVRE